MKKLAGNLKRKLLLGGLVSAGGASAMSLAFADTADVAPNDILGRILGVVCTIFRYIGIILLAWSIGMLILSFKNEDADSKSRAIMLMVVSIALIALKSVLNGILEGIGVNVGDHLSGW